MLAGQKQTIENDTHCFLINSRTPLLTFPFASRTRVDNVLKGHVNLPFGAMIAPLLAVISSSSASEKAESSLECLSLDTTSRLSLGREELIFGDGTALKH